jgi:hypothetical protein
MNLKQRFRRLILVAGATLAIAAPAAGAQPYPPVPHATPAGVTGYAYEGRDLVPLAPAVQTQRSPARVSGGSDRDTVALIAVALLAVGAAASLAVALGRRRHAPITG